MNPWGWKHAAAFTVCLVCATSALVVAGLAERAPPAAQSVAGQ